MSRRPNIVLTIADDQRGSALGCAGVEAVRTPSLDRLAARGVRCDRAYHYGSHHGAVCAPSRGMLHTGLPYTQLPAALIAGGTSRDPDVPVLPTLGSRLREAGYRSFLVGKWHNAVSAVNRSFDDGAAIFLGGMADHFFTPVHVFDPSGRYPPHDARTAEGHSTDVFGQAAVDFIRRQARGGGDEPFFLYVAFTAPHDPRTPPDAYRRLYDPRTIPKSPNVLPEHPFDNGELRVRDERLLGWPRDPAEVQRSLAEYYGMISHMDHWIGRIHDALDEAGALQDTIVVHTADHGLAVGQHGLLGKQNLYEHSIRVPLIAAGPGLPEGVVRDGLCYQHDLNPTLLQLAGAPPAGGFFRSLVPMWRGEAPGRDTIRCAYADLQRAVRDERYKLIEYRVGGAIRRQLFDLVDDPWETRDLAGRPEHGPRLAAMAKRLEAARDRARPI